MRFSASARRSCCSNILDPSVGFREGFVSDCVHAFRGGVRCVETEAVVIPGFRVSGEVVLAQVSFL